MKRKMAVIKGDTPKGKHGGGGLVYVVDGSKSQF
jgi:hypothetical protein